MKNFSSDLSLRTGCLRTKDIGYLLAEFDSLVEQDVAHTGLFQFYKDEFTQTTSNVLYKSACVKGGDRPQLVAISGDGLYWAFGSGENFQDRIRPNSDLKRKSGPFRRVQSICGRPYAIGLDRVLFRYESERIWQPFDAGLPSGGNLESISGFSEVEMFACGWEGELWQFDGLNWRQSITPTNTHLTAIVCAGDGKVYAVGHRGTILQGRRDDWRVIEQITTEGDFWDAAWFANRLWVSTTSSLYYLDADSLEPAQFGDDRPDTFYHLSVAGDSMWSIGQKDLMTFDGKSWTRLARCDARP